ncbi:lipid A-modifier LpxR family protein [Pedobacter sp. GSP4]|uniref:lipid A-modifier LpxR family protein n=1 Tax=Pedobacter sp. GSP4 TaxID=3453716 RepID=UPI003EEAB945
MKNIILLLCTVLVINSVVNAQGTEDPIHRVGAILNQDYFLKFINPSLNQDRNYTMGAALPVFQYAKMGEKGWVYAPHRFLAKAIIGKSKEDYKLIDATVMLANTTFTPLYLGNLHDPESEYKRKNDRPFASLNFIGTSLGLQSESGNELLTIGINIGAIGLDVSKAVQTTIHRDQWFGTIAPIPYGWEDQISDGGEPTLLVSGKKDWLLLGKVDGMNSRKYFQLSANAELRLGYYVSGGVGLNTRIGLLDSRNWGINALPMANATGLIETKKNLFELFLLGGIKGNGWLYNALMMGQFKDGPYQLSFNQLNKGTLDWNLGIGTKIPLCKNRAIRASVMAVGRSPEFNTVKEFERWHSWADIQLYYEW